jgi:uncharacterized RDD family membrane protein YckC
VRGNTAEAALGRGGLSTSELPLFGDRDDDTPLITQPRPPRPPLSVRRTTPEIPRTRARTVTPRPEGGEFAFPSEDDVPAEPVADAQTGSEEATDRPPANAGMRLAAAAIDVVLLGSIDAIVLYLTLALTGLTIDRIRELPMLPLATFLAIVDGGYLVAFIAAGGQTIGKMVAGVRVVGDDGRRVDVAVAVLRAIGCGMSLLTAGLGYLPGFLTADRRALQDRIAGTRVVRAR